MSNHCLYCGVEIPLMGKTGRPKKYCDDKTHKGKHTSAKKYMTPEQVQAAKDDFGQIPMHEWAKKHLTDSKGRYRPKMFEKEFGYCVGITEMVSQLSKLIEAHKGNDKLEPHRDQFNAYANQSEPEPCIECGGEVSFSGNDGVWRKLCSSACNQANMKSQHRNPTGISDPIKAAATKEERYGDAKYNGSSDNKGNHKRTHLSEDTLQKLNNGEWLKAQYSMGYTPDSLSGVLGCSSSYVRASMIKAGVEFRDNKNSNSSFELRICSLLDSLNVEYQRNVFLDFMGGKELDIYIPSKSLAIEANGSYWHSEKYSARSRHLQKFKLAKENGIKLLQVFEHDYVGEGEELFNTVILSSLGLNDKIYARNTRIGVVTTTDAKKFLIENHIQGYSKSFYNVGLYHGDELVMLATFDKPRFEKSDDYELIRMATTKELTVVGGASKLLKHFKDNMMAKGETLISYSRNDYSVGGVYEKLGFDFVKYTSCGHIWWKRGHEIVKRYGLTLGKVNTLCGTSYTGMRPEDVLRAEGYLKIYDSAQTLWRTAA